MKANWKAIGITAIAAGLLVYPAIKLVQYIASKREGGDAVGKLQLKAITPAYRGKNKAHNRNAHNHNGHGHSHS